jgi:hypothetical protein
MPDNLDNSRLSKALIISQHRNISYIPVLKTVFQKLNYWFSIKSKRSFELFSKCNHNSYRNDSFLKEELSSVSKKVQSDSFTDVKNHKANNLTKNIQNKQGAQTC